MAYTSVKEVFANIQSQLDEDPSKAKAVNGIYKFIVTGEGGGTWIVDLKADPPVVKEGDGDAQCTITVSSDDFLKIVNKELNAQMAFMTGKLKIQGDMGLAMKLGQIL